MFQGWAGAQRQAGRVGILVGKGQEELGNHTGMYMYRECREGVGKCRCTAQGRQAWWWWYARVQACHALYGMPVVEGTAGGKGRGWQAGNGQAGIWAGGRWQEGRKNHAGRGHTRRRQVVAGIREGGVWQAGGTILSLPVHRMRHAKRHAGMHKNKNRECMHGRQRRQKGERNAKGWGCVGVWWWWGVVGGGVVGKGVGGGVGVAWWGRGSPGSRKVSLSRHVQFCCFSDPPPGVVVVVGHNEG